MIDKNTGYKKPPKKNQFKKGQSGNPKGRPKGSISFKGMLKKELNSCIQTSEGTITKAEAMIKQVVNGAVLGNLKNVEQITKLYDPDKEDKNKLFIDRVIDALNLTEKEVDALLDDKYPFLRSKDVLRELTKKDILSYENAVSSVIANIMIAHVYVLDKVINQAFLIYNTVIEESTYWETIDKVLFDLDVDEKIKNKMMKKYAKTRQYERPSDEIIQFSCKYIALLLMKKNNTFAEIRDTNSRIPYYQIALERCLNKADPNSVALKYKKEYPNTSYDKKDAKQDLDLYMYKYEQLRKLEYNFSIESDSFNMTRNDYDNINNLITECSDSLLKWYYKKI